MENNNFKILYRDWANDMLLDIVESPNDYQPLAVEAAQFELDRRHLTPEQFAEAKLQQEVRRTNKDQKQQRLKEIEKRVISTGTSISDMLNPVQKSTPTTDKIIKFILLFIGVTFLYQLYKEFDMIKYMFTDTGAKWDFSMVVYFVPLLALPIVGVLFGLRKRIGWTLTAIYSSCTAAGVIPIFIMELTREPLGIPAIDAIAPPVSPVVYIWSFLAFAGLTWSLCRADVREAYQIDRRDMLTALGIGTGIVFLSALAFLL